MNPLHGQKPGKNRSGIPGIQPSRIALRYAPGTFNHEGRKASMVNRPCSVQAVEQIFSSMFPDGRAAGNKGSRPL